MEERRNRKRFWDPFRLSRKPTQVVFKPRFNGFLRSLPLHLCPAGHIVRLLGFAALRPSLFGFPDVPTCFVHPASFLPSMRSRTAGLQVFGFERGCKTVVIPSSLTGETYDALDWKLLEPVFRRNPGIETVYFSHHCQTLADGLVTILPQCRYIKRLILHNWTDARALSRVVLACKNVESIDCYAFDDAQKSWDNEASVLAMCEMIEMHPKLKLITGSTQFLGDMQTATRFSRCRHNVALVFDGCSFCGFYHLVWVLSTVVVGWILSMVAFRAAKWLWPERRVACQLIRVAFVVLTPVGLVGGDKLCYPFRGRNWVWWVKHIVLLRQSWDKFIMRM